MNAEVGRRPHDIHVARARPPSSPDPAVVVVPLRRLKKLLENDDGEAADLIIEAQSTLSSALTSTEIDKFSELVGDYNFEVALEYLSGIASRLKLNLESS